jgi:hypothetical protein
VGAVPAEVSRRQTSDWVHARSSDEAWQRAIADARHPARQELAWWVFEKQMADDIHKKQRAVSA